MLKTVYINQKKVPVPVPIRNLGEALQWVEETLVPSGHTMTRITLDDLVLSGDDLDLTARLSPESRLAVQIDSPVNLAVQALEAARNLITVVLAAIKPLAVDCWQTKPAVRPADLPSLQSDMALVLDLADHIVSLAQPMGLDTSPLSQLHEALRRGEVSLSMAASSSDWKACARLLLNRLEPYLKDFLTEAESLQLRVVATSNFALTGEGRR